MDPIEPLRRLDDATRRLAELTRLTARHPERP